MSRTNRFSLMLEALTDLVAEEKQSNMTAPSNSAENATAPVLPPLHDIIASYRRMPREALFLGLAEDGLPVLLNLYDPIPGPLLVTGDQASGKTALLQTVARALGMMHTPSEVEFGVITDHPEDWSDFQSAPNSAGIYHTRENAAPDFIHSLVTWAHNNKGEQQSVLLLIDDLASLIERSRDTDQNLRWLLLRGPSRRVWPIVTLNAGRAEQVQAWLGFFRTRLFGHIQDAAQASFLTGNRSARFDNLFPGSQFAMPEGNKWLHFWIPANGRGD